MILVRPKNPSTNNPSKIMMYKSGEGINHNPVTLNGSDDCGGALA